MNTFDFIGFDVSKSLQDLASSRLTALVKSAPTVVSHDAYIVLTRKGIYEGSIKIHSTVGSFRASAKGADPKHVLQELYRRIKGQILQWNLKHPSLIYLLRKGPSGSSGSGSGCAAPAALAS